MDERTPLNNTNNDSPHVADAVDTGRDKAQQTAVPMEYVAAKYRSYGTMTAAKRKSNLNAQQRSTSVPVNSTRLVFIKRPVKQLTVGQQSAKLAEQAKRNFFHGLFTSSHGAVFTVPNRAQQKATTLPSHVPHSGGAGVKHVSRSASSSRLPLSLDSSVHYPSALKKTPAPAPITHDELRRSGTAGGPFEPLVLKRRAASADARMHAEEVVIADRSLRQKVVKHSFRESSPDMVALDAMRQNAAATDRKPTLSPTTIAKAKRALRFFEEKKVRLPKGSFSDASVINVDGKTMAVPTQSPLVLSGSTSRRVQISAFVQEDEDSYEGTDEEESETQEEDFISWTDAFMDLMYLAAPAAVSICFTFSMSVVPLAFIGSILGERDLTGASVGYFITCILILYPMIGLTFAMDTLCSHEYGRDTLSPEMGLVLQRGVLINIILLTPLCILIYYLDAILVPIYGPNVAHVAEEFLVFAPLYIFPIMFFIAFNKFLNNQMQPHIPMIALTAGVILMPFLQLKLTPLGVRYTMVGMGITAWFQLIVVVVITLFKPETRMTLGTWRLREALDWVDVKEYMKLAIPSAIFVAAEASSFDLTVLLCAQFSEADGAAWSAIMNSLFIFASLSGGLSASACANIGRCIGAYQPYCAKRFVLLSILAAFAIGVIDSTVLVIFYDFLMSLFGTQGKTLQMAREVLVFLPFFHIADSVQFAFQGIFSGLGKNHLGAIILLSCLWCIGIPLSFLFGQYLGYNMYGTCIGLTIGLCIEAPAMVIAASTMNYTHICDRFFEEMEDEESEEEEEEESEEEYDEEYVEEVMRRSGISTASNEFGKEYAEQYERLRPPRRRRRRQLVYVDDEGVGA